MHTVLETLFMIQYKICSFGFLESSKMNQNLFCFIIKKVHLISPLFLSGFSVGHDIFSFEGVLTCELDAFETE